VIAVVVGCYADPITSPEPDVLRLAPIPLYNSYGDVFAAVNALAQALRP